MTAESLSDERPARRSGPVGTRDPRHCRSARRARAESNRFRRGLGFRALPRDHQGRRLPEPAPVYLQVKGKDCRSALGKGPNPALAHDAGRLSESRAAPQRNPRRAPAVFRVHCILITQHAARCRRTNPPAAGNKRSASAAGAGFGLRPHGAAARATGGRCDRSAADSPLTRIPASRRLQRMPDVAARHVGPTGSRIRKARP